MDSTEREYVAELSAKYNVSSNGLMDLFGIKYRSSKYYYKDTGYQSFVSALRAADSTHPVTKLSGNKRNVEITNNAKSGDESNVKLMNFIFALSLIVWPLFAFGSLFLFDAPGSNNSYMLIAALSIWSYPIFVLIARSVSSSLVSQNEVNKGFLWSCLPMANIFIFFVMFSICSGQTTC